jgi:hypothetical protein
MEVVKKLEKSFSELYKIKKGAKRVRSSFLIEVKNEDLTLLFSQPWKL